MNSYQEFPWKKVIYNWICFISMQGAALWITASLGAPVIVVYLGILVSALLLTWVTICNRCGYYDRRCALGMGKIAPLLRHQGDRTQYCRTKPQLIAVVLFGISILIPIAGSIWLGLRGDLFGPVLFIVFLIALVLPHPRLMCRYCEQRICGACAIGNWLVKS